MKPKDMLIILIAVAIAGGLLLLSRQLGSSGGRRAGGQLPQAATEPPAEDTRQPAEETKQPAEETKQPGEETEQPGEETAPARTEGPAADGISADDPGTAPTLIPAQAYLSVQIDKIVYDPIPLLEENLLELVQPDGKRNVIAFTPQGILMHSANCDNQDCVRQGEVTLNNRGKRVLSNMIICLPNRVVLSLLTPEEANKQWQQLNAIR